MKHLCPQYVRTKKGHEILSKAGISAPPPSPDKGKEKVEVKKKKDQMTKSYQLPCLSLSEAPLEGDEEIIILPAPGDGHPSIVQSQVSPDKAPDAGPTRDEPAGDDCPLDNDELDGLLNEAPEDEEEDLSPSPTGTRTPPEVYDNDDQLMISEDDIWRKRIVESYQALLWLEAELLWDQWKNDELAVWEEEVIRRQNSHLMDGIIQNGFYSTASVVEVLGKKYLDLKLDGYSQALQSQSEIKEILTILQIQHQHYTEQITPEQQLLLICVLTALNVHALNTAKEQHQVGSSRPLGTNISEFCEPPYSC